MGSKAISPEVYKSQKVHKSQKVYKSKNECHSERATAVVASRGILCLSSCKKSAYLAARNQFTARRSRRNGWNGPEKRFNFDPSSRSHALPHGSVVLHFLSELTPMAASSNLKRHGYRNPWHFRGEVMRSLSSLMLFAVLAFSPALAAENLKGNSASQNPPAAPTASTQLQSGASETQQPVTASQPAKQKNPKVKKVKKSSCVSPPAGSGLPDYCKSPYWDPKDWNYISINGGTDTVKHAHGGYLRAADSIPKSKRPGTLRT